MSFDLGELLRSHGQRLTEPRRLVWQVLESAGGHLTAQELAERVRVVDPSVNLSSVYRSLTLFADLDLVRESNLGVDEASRWEPTHADDHFHLVCRACGKVDHHAGEIVDQTRSHLDVDHGFRADRIELVATGLCAACASS